MDTQVGAGRVASLIRASLSRSAMPDRRTTRLGSPRSDAQCSPSMGARGISMHAELVLRVI